MDTSGVVRHVVVNRLVALNSVGVPGRLKDSAGKPFVSAYVNKYREELHPRLKGQWTKKPGEAGGGEQTIHEKRNELATQGMIHRKSGRHAAIEDWDYLTEEEQSELKYAAAKTLVDSLDRMADYREVATVAMAGKAKRGWYEQSAKAIMHVFGTDAPRFTALLASLSPRTSVELNTLNALNMWVAWNDAGRPKDPGKIRRLAKFALKGPDLDEDGNKVKSKKKDDPVMDAWVRNMTRSLVADDLSPDTFRLSGPKVNSFYRNLSGYVNEVTGDAWMATYFGVMQNLFGGDYEKSGDPFLSPDLSKKTGEWAEGTSAEGTHKKGSIGTKSGGYLAMAVTCRKAAEHLTELTGEEWTPAEVQECVWSWAKTLYEHSGPKTKKKEFGAPVPATTKTGEPLLDKKTGQQKTRKMNAEEFVRSGKMTDDLIGGTPDFASLFAKGVYAEAIKRSGHAAEIAGLGDIARFGHAGSGTSGEAGSGSGVAGETKASSDRVAQLAEFHANAGPRLIESAKRLDLVKARRRREAVITARIKAEKAKAEAEAEKAAKESAADGQGEKSHEEMVHEAIVKHGIAALSGESLNRLALVLRRVRN